jgi:hypothetical protein
MNVNELKLPHQCIITINIDLYERLPNGMVKPPAINRHAEVFTIMGDSKKDCYKKISEFLQKDIPIMYREVNHNDNNQS